MMTAIAVIRGEYQSISANAPTNVTIFVIRESCWDR